MNRFGKWSIESEYFFRVVCLHKKAVKALLLCLLYPKFFRRTL